MLSFSGNSIRLRYILLAAGFPILFLAITTIIFSIDEAKNEPQKIAVLMSGESRRERLTGLQHGLSELGFYDGQQILYLIASAGENRQKLPALAKELIQTKPAAIVALGGLEADAALQAQIEAYKETSHMTPVIFAGVASAAARGLYQNTLPPGQITGIENLEAELSGKRLEYFQKLIPGLKRVGVVYEPGIIPSEQGLRIAQETARLLGLEILVYPIRSSDDIAALETTLQPGACDGLLLMPSFLIESGGENFLHLSLNKKLPVFGLRVQDASANYFASFGPNVYHQGRQTARLAAKILNQAPLSDIPVEVPDRVELVINVEIASQIGLVLTPAQLQYADQLAGRSVR